MRPQVQVALSEGSIEMKDLRDVRRLSASAASKRNSRKLLVMALASLTVILAASRSAEAVSISPGSALQITTTTYNSTINTPEEWLKYLGLSPAPVLLYKSNVDKTSAVGLGVDEGQYADNYKTTFSNPANDPANALIEYLGGSAISCGTCYLLVKGGNQVPSQYLFDLSKWNGTESLVLS